MTKFKVGDKVKIVATVDELEDIGISRGSAEELVGKIVTIKKVYYHSFHDHTHIEVKESSFTFDDKNFALVTWENYIKPGMLVKTANGNWYYAITEKKGIRAHRWVYFDDKDPDFNPVAIYTINDTYITSLTSMIGNLEVFADKLVWQREESKKEMSVADIEKELGYSIKIVKESKEYEF